MRERTHRNTAESTNARVKWWSIFQLGVLLGEGVFQVWWLKRFFEVCPTRDPQAICILLTRLVGQACSLDSNIGSCEQAIHLKIFWILPLDQHFLSPELRIRVDICKRSPWKDTLRLHTHPFANECSGRGFSLIPVAKGPFLLHNITWAGSGSKPVSLYAESPFIFSHLRFTLTTAYRLHSIDGPERKEYTTAFDRLSPLLHNCAFLIPHLLIVDSRARQVSHLYRRQAYWYDQELYIKGQWSWGNVTVIRQKESLHIPLFWF